MGHRISNLLVVVDSEHCGVHQHHAGRSDVHGRRPTPAPEAPLSGAFKQTMWRAERGSFARKDEDGVKIGLGGNPTCAGFVFYIDNYFLERAIVVLLYTLYTLLLYCCCSADNNSNNFSGNISAGPCFNTSRYIITRFAGERVARSCTTFFFLVDLACVRACVHAAVPASALYSVSSAVV